MVVSLNSPFGSGKTWFLKDLERELTSRLENKKQSPIPILLNAWQDDHYADPLGALILGLLDAICSHKKHFGTTAFGIPHSRILEVVIVAEQISTAIRKKFL